MAVTNLDDPSRFLLGSEEHVTYWRKLLAIDAWFGVTSFEDIDQGHMKGLAAELMRAESKGKPTHRKAIQWERSLQNTTPHDCEQMRLRIDKEMEYLGMSWKVGSMFLFRMDVAYTKLTMTGYRKSRWGDKREFLIFELRLYGLEDLAGFDQESMEKDKLSLELPGNLHLIKVKK